MRYTFLQSFLNTNLICIFIPEYIFRKRIGPVTSYKSNDEREFLLADQELLYLTRILARNPSLPTTIPSWTEFNIILRKDVPVSRSLSGYLDFLDATATDNSIIHNLLRRSRIIKEKLELPSMVRVYDQVIFAKTEKIKSLVLVMGGFHTLMMFLGVIETRFKGYGLHDILLQIEVLVDGSAEWLMTSSMYNHSVRMCKLMYESLNKMLITEIKKKCSIYCTKDVYNLLPLGWNKESYYRRFVDSGEIKRHAIAFYDCQERICQQSLLTTFRVSYLNIVTVPLNFIYSFPAGNWYIYLESIRNMLPWIFTTVLAI